MRVTTCFEHFKFPFWLSTSNVSTMSDSDIAERLHTVLKKIDIAFTKRPKELQYAKPRLVAVSKTKPLDMIIAAYECGQRHFGENYIQELLEKSNDPEILDKCKDIHWHYIGHLQRNKVPKLNKIPRLYMIETIDCEKIASAVDSAWSKGHEGDLLRIMVQVNTSGEEEKSGIEPSKASTLVKFILDECPNLKFAGLMTIGQFGYDYSKGPNPDFQCLATCGDEVSKALGLSRESIELSMGMSDDYEHAIELGSTNVRVGSSIFGSRVMKSTGDTSKANTESSGNH